MLHRTQKHMAFNVWRNFMHRKFLLLFLPLSLLTTLTTATHASESNMRPGSWEISSTSHLLSLAEQIPPEQMQNLSKLAKQYGFDMPQIKNGAANSKVCITKDMAAQDIPPSLYHAQSGCEVRNATRVENRYSADLACASDQINGQGKTEAILSTPESFTGQSTFKGTIRGIAVDEQANTTGRWLSPTCESTQ